jgi:hypothetical protein
MNWEYTTVRLAARGLLGGKIDEDELGTTLNAFGSEGWELITTLDTNLHYGSTRHLVLVFKRPRE